MKYTEELDKVSYCFGLSIASNLLSSGVNTINTEAFVDAITTCYAGQMPEIKPEDQEVAAEENADIPEIQEELPEKKRKKNLPPALDVELID